jgi:uncharacterized protein
MFAHLIYCAYNKSMQTTFDPSKDAANIAKHGVSLAAAESIEWATLWAKADDRAAYGEERMIGYAYIGERLYCVVYTDRGNTRRVISLRKANSREVKRYAET